MTEGEFITRSEKIKSRLYRTALMYLGGEHAALDAVDEAIYRGFRGYKKLREEAFFETWLTRILINLCKDELKRQNREITMDSVPEVSQEYLDTLPLKEAVAALPEELRAVIILRYFTGLTL
ncbi:MAG: RNA polymerase subunit sigma-24, partial [Oscillibacter sp.]|nr:RNA polymerase subunit sigma-24 [Oscillibacter sp.]